MAKRRLTPFARFVLFILVFLPLVYVGSAYYTGDTQQIDKLKSYITGESTSSSPSSSNSGKSSSSSSNSSTELQRLRTENRQLRAENEELKARIKLMEDQGTAAPSSNRQKWGK